MASHHLKLTVRYGEALVHSVLPAQTATLAIQFDDGATLNTDAQVMVGPDGQGWVWFDTQDVSVLRRFVEQPKVVAAATGVLADGANFTATECVFDTVNGQGGDGTVMRGEKGVEIRLTDPLSVTVLMAVSDGCQTILNTEADEQVEYTLLNAIFDGIDKSVVDDRGSVRFDSFKVATAHREWVLRTKLAFGESEKKALEAGAVHFFPTATLSAPLKPGESIEDLDQEASAICWLLALATGASVRWTVREVRHPRNVDTLFSGFRPSVAVSNRSHYSLISNHRPPRGLQEVLRQCVDPFLAHQSALALNRAIGFLEECRVQHTVEVELVLAILAVESLTYYWCLNDGLSSDALKDMNIETKLRRMAKRYPGLDRRVLDAGLLRDDVRNPLMHRGELPAMTLDEMIDWAHKVYVLAFRMTLTILGYTGQFADPTKASALADASFVIPGPP